MRVILSRMKKKRGRNKEEWIHILRFYNGRDIYFVPDKCFNEDKVFENLKPTGWNQILDLRCLNKLNDIGMRQKIVEKYLQKWLWIRST